MHKVHQHYKKVFGMNQVKITLLVHKHVPIKDPSKFSNILQLLELDIGSRKSMALLATICQGKQIEMMHVLLLHHFRDYRGKHQDSGPEFN